MTRRQLDIGIVLSTTGSYAAVGRSMRAGADLAIAEVNADRQAAVTLHPVAIDPGGVQSAYGEAMQALLVDRGLTHVLGCYTSSSRKDVLPLFEKNDALLWYPSHYEGFETSENVVYTGAAPNQHIIPLVRHLLCHHGKRGWLVGSNYIWAWENNRILREALSEVGGAVIGERYFPVGETDLRAVARQIVSDRPDFIFTTLIGHSCYEFFRLLRAEAAAAGIDQPRALPIASCSLSEAELPMIGDSAAGHLSSSVYFSTIRSEANDRFTAQWDRHYAHLGRACADAEAAYIAIHLLALAVAKAGSTGFAEMRAALGGIRFAAPQGLVTVDPDNLHCCLRPRIGRSTDHGTFDILHEDPAPVWPDPYLVWASLGDVAPRQAPAHLQVVR
ncbi:aliphatic amidase expression-regulating protein [Paracoccus liaowanqingii]|uniref:Aliphatic amidase expression-regulating protein n=1 Tax=Paracoccus liaowanqingii TaxID=2560053 RepID=A0A4Z1CQT8_9RHOB|nr:transporter substrate-binding domain-containing protein [Paracoccus liaowanqingii]QDA36412.1 aliphatic amidase expression-regulating protein [Paracoccus liaowanqingii]TGN67487.1 aliphatic amidase expression-regulating protein [Paracoccus liaowanqingii]